VYLSHPWVGRCTSLTPVGIPQCYTRGYTSVLHLCTTVVYPSCAQRWYIPPVHNGGYLPSAQRWLSPLCTTLRFSPLHTVEVLPLCTPLRFSLLHNVGSPLCTTLGSPLCTTVVIPLLPKGLFSFCPKVVILPLPEGGLFSREVYPEGGFSPVRFIPKVVNSSWFKPGNPLQRGVLHKERLTRDGERGRD